MNLLDAFNELDQLEEAFAGDYKSPYLTLPDAERLTAQKQYERGKNHLCKATPNGMAPVSKFDLYYATDFARRNFHFVLDYEAFHKAYDIDLEKAGLLTMFKADGTIGPKSCYGNIKEANLSKTDPAYKAAIEIWSWLFSEKDQMKRWNTITAKEAEKLVKTAKEAEEHYKQYQADKAAKEAKFKADTEAANVARAALEDVLVDALDLVDVHLMEQLEELGAEIAITREGTKNLLFAEDVLNVEIPILPSEEYTPEYLSNIITKALLEADLSTKIEHMHLGLTTVRKHKERCKGCRVMGYWLDNKNSTIYESDSTGTKLINKKTRVEATAQDLKNCELVLVICSNIGERKTHRATEDVTSYYYYSYNEEKVQNSDLLDLLPVDEAWYLQERILNYYDQGFEQASKISSSFVDFPGFDVWLSEKVTDYGNG